MKNTNVINLTTKELKEIQGGSEASHNWGVVIGFYFGAIYHGVVTGGIFK